MRKKSGLITALLAVAIIAGFFAQNIPSQKETIADILREQDTQSEILQSENATRTIKLSPSRSAHIIYGDDRGGGHKHGIGKPCKSEFPSDWDDLKIIKTVKKIAANDNLNWEKQSNGYYVAETFEGPVLVRVVLGPNKENIITAYPTNVPLNPCPANDN